jgi:hypothetical protein
MPEVADGARLQLQRILLAFFPQLNSTPMGRALPESTSLVAEESQCLTSIDGIR